MSRLATSHISRPTRSRTPPIRRCEAAAWMEPYMLPADRRFSRSAKRSAERNDLRGCRLAKSCTRVRACCRLDTPCTVRMIRGCLVRVTESLLRLRRRSIAGLLRSLQSRPISEGGSRSGVVGGGCRPRTPLESRSRILLQRSQPDLFEAPFVRDRLRLLAVERRVC